MPKNGNSKNIIIALLLVLAIGVAAFYSGLVQIQSTPTVIDESEVASSCPLDQKTVVSVYAVESVLSAQTTEQSVTTGNAYIYRNGDNRPFDTLAISASGDYVSSTANHELECGTDSFRVIIGDEANDGSGYYLEESKEELANQQNEKRKFVLDRIGGLTLSLENSTAHGLGDDAFCHNFSFAVGPVQGIILKMQEDAGGVVRAPDLFFKYNTSIIDEIYVSGGRTLPVPANLSGYVQGSTTGINEIRNFGTKYVPILVKFKTADVYDMTSINITVMDKAPFIKEGALNEGFEDSVSHRDVGSGKDSIDAWLRC